MKYIEQSVKTLRLNIINSEYDESLLTILTKEKNKVNDYDIEYGILGESHFIKIKKEDFVFAEIFACIEIKIENSFLLTGNVNNKKVFHENKNISYSFESKVLTWDKEGEKIYNYFETNQTSSIIFPKQEKDKFLAKTQVIFKNVSDSIIFETIHSYPNEEKIVVTKSEFKLKKEKENV